MMRKMFMEILKIWGLDRIRDLMIMLGEKKIEIIEVKDRKDGGMRKWNKIDLLRKLKEKLKKLERSKIVIGIIKIREKGKKEGGRVDIGVNEEDIECKIKCVRIGKKIKGMKKIYGWKKMLGKSKINENDIDIMKGRDKSERSKIMEDIEIRNEDEERKRRIERIMRKSGENILKKWERGIRRRGSSIEIR